VVLNLTMMDPDQAQRAVDVAGGTYAMDGHQERIGESIFLFTPICVQVTTQLGVVHEVPQSAYSKDYGSYSSLDTGIDADCCQVKVKRVESAYLRASPKFLRNSFLKTPFKNRDFQLSSLA